jgi:hypothetical protein
MKTLILFLVLAISTQPLQAEFCAVDMEMNQEGAHQMDHSDHDAPDCCDSDDSNQTQGCDNNMNCGMCFLSTSALPDLMKLNPVWGHHYSLGLSSDLVLPSHSSPPFRPPIS